MQSIAVLPGKRAGLRAALFVAYATTSSSAQLPKLWADDSIVSQRLGQTRHFNIALPAGYEDPEAQANRYPVFVVLSVNPSPLSTLILSAQEQTRLGVWALPQLIVVNVLVRDNSRDLYPPLTGDAGRVRPTAGGADAFGEFLVNELVPLLRTRYRTLPYVIIGGQSAGGQFAIRAFALYPETFQAAIAPSPALVWNDNAVIDRYAEQIAHRKAPGRLYVAAGGYDPSTLAVAELRFAARLKALKPVATTFEFRRFPDDGHSSIEIPGYVDGLRWVFKPVSLARNPIDSLARNVGDSVGAPRAYERLKRQYAAGARIFGMPEGLPDEFLRTKAAVQGPFREPNVLERQLCDDDIAWHPDNAYAYMCLGQLLLRRGDTSGARNTYDKSLTVARKAGWTSTVATVERRIKNLDSVWSAPGKRSVVGRWALVSLAINGVDRTNRSATDTGAVAYYTFTADGRFRIVRGDSVSETGTWSVDTTVSPAFFDHIPDQGGKPGPYVPGIFAIEGDTLKISIVAPNAARKHPTQFRSSPADSSWLLVFTRARR